MSSNHVIKKAKCKLPVGMTDQEYHEKAKELVDRMSHLQDMADEIEEVKSMHKENMKTEEKEIEKCRLELKHNYRVKEIDVYEIFNFETGTVYMRRADNNEIVPGKFRAMTEEEKAMPDSLIPDVPKKEAVLLLPSPEEVKLCQAQAPEDAQEIEEATVVETVETVVSSDDSAPEEGTDEKAQG